MVPIEIRDSIPDFKTFRVWNATKKRWVSKRYTRRGDALNGYSMWVGSNDINVLVTTSIGEVKYELI